jgi:hypothetical protein
VKEVAGDHAGEQEPNLEQQYSGGGKRDCDA